MKVLTTSLARAKFCAIARQVLRTGKPAVVRTPKGLIQIEPCTTDPADLARRQKLFASLWGSDAKFPDTRD